MGERGDENDDGNSAAVAEHFVSWYKSGSRSICTFLWRDGNEEKCESSVNVNVDGNDVNGAREYMDALPGINGEMGDGDGTRDVNSNAEVNK